MCAFRPCISFTPKNTRHRSPTDLCNAVENQAAGLFFIYRFVLSLQEGRRPSRPGGRRAPLISIHAPARGATGPARRSRPNPLFQFTPLREGRRTLLPGAGRRDYFNSRPCERGDKDTRDIKALFDISIHAPARGATRVQRFKPFQPKFQFTPLREGRHACTLRTSGSCRISIHAPARGATRHGIRT